MLITDIAIGALSILLAAGLGLLGVLERVNHVIGGMVSKGGVSHFPKTLPGWAPWLATVFFGFGLSFAILSVGGTWRRLVLWITALVLVAAWGPVLALAAYAPDIAAPLIAVLWSGVCALIYARNHRMSCDMNHDFSEIISPDSPDEAR